MNVSTMDLRYRVLTSPWPILIVIGAWVWAIWSCAEHWLGNPNYSFGWVVPALAIGFALRRYLRMDRADSSSPPLATSVSIFSRISLGMLAGAGVFALEYSREQMWHPEIVLWLICLLAVASTIAICRFRGGPVFARAELFPVLFFLTAVSWPPRFEQPIVSSLMRWVADTTTELLRWLGIEAQTSGAAIALRSGLVGISQACSGIRSLQAGIMFGLAMGEWFLLRPARRLILLFVAIALALATNLARTLALSLQAEWNGIDSLDRVHDLIGNVMISTLIVGTWIAGKLLAPRERHRALLSTQEIAERTRLLFHKMMTPAAPMFRVLGMSLLAGIICARAVYAWVETRDRTQTEPFFVARIDNSSQLVHLSREIWNELRPTQGECIRHLSTELPGGAADCFHFFWKPSAWNRFVLVHRPDICMPGVGWEQIEAPERLDITLDGRSIQCHLFRFRRGNVYALELWGVWRNGEPVPLEYEPAQVLGAAVSPSSLHLEGKRRSATEIVACNVIANAVSPPDQMAVAVLQSVFQYKAP